MNIFPFTAIDSLIAVESEMNTSKDKTTYIKDSLTELSHPMIKYFNKVKGHYLFHRAFYVGDDKKFISIDLPHEKQNKQVEIFIQSIEKDIDKALIRASFTELLNDNLRTGLCLFNGPLTGDHKLKLNDFLFFDLAKGKNEKLEEFLNAIPRSLDILLYNYRTLAQAFSPTYIYFIRPFTKLPHYNGSINLILRRPLTHAEYMEIGYVWTKILSDTAMVESIEEEQERIFEEHTHLSRTEFMALNQYIETLAEQLKDAGTSVYQASAGTIQSAQIKIQELRDAIEFNLYLMKSQQGKTDYRQFLKNTTVPMMEAVNVNELLCKIIDGLVVVLNAQLIASPLVNLRVERLMSIKKTLVASEHQVINANYTGLRIVFNDLLKNALDHSGEVQPILDVRIVKDSKGLAIHFINGEAISKEAANYINSNVFSSKVTLTGRYGIRTIKRILNSHFFQQKDQSWYFGVTPDSLNGPTDIYLHLTSDKS